MIDKTDLRQLRDLASGHRKDALNRRDKETILELLSIFNEGDIRITKLLRVTLRNMCEAEEWRNIANRRLRDNIALNEILIEFAYGKWWEFIFCFRRLRALALSALNGN
jgi:hypothetical protein